MDMLEKSDPPPIPDGYAMSVSFACLLDVTKSVSSVVTLGLEGEERRVDREERQRKQKEQGLAVDEQEEDDEDNDDRPRSVDSVLATVNKGCVLFFLMYPYFGM